jgi:hypothetical protein
VRSTAVDVDGLGLFVDATNGAPQDITDANTADLSSLAADFGLV